MKAKQVFFTIVISALTAVAAVFGYNQFQEGNNNHNPNFTSLNVPANYAGFFDTKGYTGAPVDFTEAAAAAIPTVVHIKTKSTKEVSNNLPNRGNPFSQLFGDDMLKQLFGQSPQSRAVPQLAMGSGVIISKDGYIVTNNHVVSGADKITVTLSDRKTYTAKVVGADANYDLAVIKIDAQNLPFMVYGNSSNVKVGQWVLAVGYPLTLDATVTAGIISAKGRSLGLNGEGNNKQFAVESYLQTDAAVNRGNSGGPLVDTNGQMIGINSAIASPTGFYSGYSYAIPVDIVKKVISDLIKYGSVQRGFIGAMYMDASGLSAQQKETNGLPAYADGIYITNLVKDGAAAQAGMKTGDIIREIEGVKINSSSVLQEELSHFRPGDKVKITFERDGKDQTVTVTLKNKAGTYDIVKADAATMVLGAELETLSKSQAKKLNLEGGVIVKKINQGILNDQTRMRDGFIIVSANGKDVKTLEDLQQIMKGQEHVTITGVYPGYNEPFQYPLDLSGGN